MPNSCCQYSSSFVAKTMFRATIYATGLVARRIDFCGRELSSRAINRVKNMTTRGVGSGGMQQIFGSEHVRESPCDRGLHSSLQKKSRSRGIHLIRLLPNMTWSGRGLLIWSRSMHDPLHGPWAMFQIIWHPGGGKLQKSKQLGLK